MEDQMNNNLKPGKYITWVYNNGTTKTYKVKETTYEYFSKKKISVFRLILGLLFEKGFAWKFVETIKYALVHYEEYRGAFASDVILLIRTKTYNKLFK